MPNGAFVGQIRGGNSSECEAHFQTRLNGPFVGPPDREGVVGGLWGL